MTQYDVILPAGGRIYGDFATEMGTAVKALVKFGDKTLLLHTIQQLRACPFVRRIVVIGPKQVEDHPAAMFADARIPEGVSGPDNIRRGLHFLHRGAPGRLGKVLICASDLPFLTAENLTEFIDRCSPTKEIHIPICTKQSYDARFPGSQSTFVTLTDGVFTSGSVFLFDGDAFERNIEHIERLFKARKSKLRMAMLIGPVFAYKLLTNRISLEQVQGKVLEIVKCRGEAVQNTAPELSFDVDDLDDYNHALEFVGSMPSWQ